MEKKENTGIEQSGSKENHTSSSSNNAPHPRTISNIEGELFILCHLINLS